MRKSAKVLSIILLILLLITVSSFLVISYMYRGVFPYNTYINNKYCTGLDVAACNELLCKDAGIGDTVNISIGDEKHSIAAESIDLSVDYTDKLDIILNSQSNVLWVERFITGPAMYEVEPDIHFDEDKLKQEFDALRLDRQGAPFGVSLTLTDKDGYVLENNKPYQIDPGRVYPYVREALGRGELSISIEDGYVEKPVYTGYEQQLIDIDKALKALEDVKITYWLDNNSTKISLPRLSKSELISMLELDNRGYPMLDDSGKLVFSEESVKEGLNSILGPYNTYKNHIFTTHDGSKVHIKGGNFGSTVDIDTESMELYEYLTGGTKQPYKKTLEMKGKSKGSGVIGDNYLEVSLDEQHLYYYENGALVLDSDVVTGNHAYGYDTPQGVYSVYFMQRNRTLVGETYRSFVNYWIAFYNHYGVHDASWRNEFGGDIYLHNGSHGCVNTPKENVSKLYDMIEVGTPVIVYSYDKTRIKD